MSFNDWIQGHSMLINIVFGLFFVGASMEFYSKRKDKMLLLFLAFGYLYPLGWAIKVYHWGPVVLRGYVADLGFVPFFTLMGLMNYHRDKKMALSKARRMTFYGFVIAMNVEFFQLYFINPMASQQKVSVPVRGDWMDVTIFVATMAITFYLLHRLKVRDTPPLNNEVVLPRAERRRNRSKEERRKSRHVKP